jgi:hypothetical protein
MRSLQFPEDMIMTMHACHNLRCLEHGLEARLPGLFESPGNMPLQLSPCARSAYNCMIATCKWLHVYQVAYKVLCRLCGVVQTGPTTLLRVCQHCMAPCRGF